MKSFRPDLDSDNSLEQFLEFVEDYPRTYALLKDTLEPAENELAALRNLRRIAKSLKNYRSPGHPLASAYKNDMGRTATGPVALPVTTVTTANRTFSYQSLHDPITLFSNPDNTFTAYYKGIPYTSPNPYTLLRLFTLDHPEGDL